MEKIPKTKPTNQSATKKGFSFLGWLFEVTASDPDFTPVRKQRKVKSRIPLTVKQKLKRFFTLIFVVLVFYLLLCGYILLNPSDAQFFNNVFGLEYVTIQFILEYTIYIVFGLVATVLLVLFLFFFYRGLTIKTKEVLRKWGIRGAAIIFGLLFFGNLATFAGVYNHFQSINFENLEGRILLYDNTILKYLSEGEKSAARLDPTRNVIGPVVVRYDLSGYIRGAEFRDGLSLSQEYVFEVDYDGDEQLDYPSGTIDLSVPLQDSRSARVIMRIQEPGEYQPVGKIRGLDVGGNPITLDIPFPKITVENIVQIETFEQQEGGVKYGFDGSSLRDFGVLNWRITSLEDAGQQGYKYYPNHVFRDIDVICMNVFEGTYASDASCDWRYVTEDASELSILGDLTYIEDPVDRFRYQFEVKDLSFKDGELRSLEWYINDLKYVGGYESGTPKILDYTFRDGGNHIVTAVVEDTTGRIREFQASVVIGKYVQLKNGFAVQIVDEEGINLAAGTYDKQTDTYIIEEVPVPHVIQLDGNNVRASSTRLRLAKVQWDLDNDGEYETTQGKIDFELPTPGRYDIRVKYTFEDLTVAGGVEELTRVERISFIGVEKELDVRVRITQDGQYAPAKIRFDASGSKTTDGSIAKFLYDFGDGNTHEGEGVATYLYDEPGEYEVRVTAVKTDGKRATRHYTIIIKKPQEVAKINTSIASGRIVTGKPVSLDAFDTLGDVESVTWDLGDGTGPRTGKSIVHSYKTPGTYVVKLSVKYFSGIIEEAEKELVVIEG